MSRRVISVEHLSKMYRLGVVNHGRLAKDIQSWWARLRGVEDPNSAVALPTRKSFEAKSDRFWALRDVSFEVEQGERLGIIGRNGAGKSTLLKILSRVTTPTEGVVKVRGRVASLLEVGTGFNPELTGRENIYLNGAILGMTKAEVKRKFDEIVSFAEVEKFIETPLKRYSSGMYVRLAFAVAAHLEPHILLVDEVLAVGDVKFQKKCLGKMEDVSQSQGRTVLFVSHDMAAIRRLCPRAILMLEGCIAENGPSERVVNVYLSEGQRCGAEKTWPDLNRAPGDALLRLRAARVLDRGGAVSSRHDIRNPIRVEIDYWSAAQCAGVVPGIHLYDEKGNCVFMSYDHNRPGWGTQVSAGGIYRGICEIPGNLLAEGKFYVSPALNVEAGKSTSHAFERDAVAFEVFDPSEGDSVRGQNNGYWGGMVRPMLSWSTSRAGENLGLGGADD